MLTTRLITRFEELTELERDWAALVERSGCVAITSTPTWVLPWWRTFGASDGRELCSIAVASGGRLVGLAPFLRRPQRNRAGMPFRQIELLASGEDEQDEIGSDYLGVIVERGEEGPVARALAAVLTSPEFGAWDELSLRAMNGDSPFPLTFVKALADYGIPAHTEVVASSHHVRIPRTWSEYLEDLPAARRYMVRRSLRDFDRWAGGTTHFARARTRDELAHGLEILKALHAERWSDAGKSGVFASRRFCEFHESVMPALLDMGALDLRWLTVRGAPTCALYNLVWQKKVHFYQSGRSIRLPRTLRPGIVMHAHAIQMAIADGLEEYDFLAGQARYKAELGPLARPIVNLTAARPSLSSAARRVVDLAIDLAKPVRRALLAKRPAVDRPQAVPYALDDAGKAPVAPKGPDHTSRARPDERIPPASSPRPAGVVTRPGRRGRVGPATS